MRFFIARVPLISGDDTDDRLECGGGLFDVMLKADIHISQLVASGLFKHILPQTKYPSQLLQLVTASPGLLDFAFFSFILYDFVLSTCKSMAGITGVGTHGSDAFSYCIILINKGIIHKLTQNKGIIHKLTQLSAN